MPTIPDLTPPDYSTALGQVRALIPDIEQLEDQADPTALPEYIFSDSVINAYLAIYSGNIKRAAAQAKLVLATSESLISKVIKTYDFSTDGAKLGAELRAQAKMLQDEADKDDMVDSYETFIIAPLTRKARIGDDWA